MGNYKTTGAGYKSSGAIVATERKDRLSSKQFIATQQLRGRQLINDWLKAIQAAEHPERPNREQLYKLYKNISSDADLTTEWETRRKLRVTGAGFSFLDENNKPVDEITKMFQKKWFFDLLGHALDSKVWGHSLIDVKSINSDGTIGDVELINRRYLIPSKGIHVTKIGDEKGTQYREDNSLWPFLFEFGEGEDLGLFLKAAPYVLFMRFALATWTEYAEKFVMPVRVGKTNSKDDESMSRLETMMLEMATASFAILDKEEEFEFIETSKTDGSSVFDKLMITCAAKLSKLFNGSVIGEGNNGGSNAKEKVGQDIQDLVTDADMMWFEGIMNQSVMPKLEAMGYPVAGLTFKFNRADNLAAEWAIAAGILKYYEIPEEEITDKFGWTVTKRLAPVADGAEALKPTAEGNANFF